MPRLVETGHRHRRPGGAGLRRSSLDRMARVGASPRSGDIHRRPGQPHHAGRRRRDRRALPASLATLAADGAPATCGAAAPIDPPLDGRRTRRLARRTQASAGTRLDADVVRLACETVRRQCCAGAWKGVAAAERKRRERAAQRRGEDDAQAPLDFAGEGDDVEEAVG